MNSKQVRFILAFNMVAGFALLQGCKSTPQEPVEAEPPVIQEETQTPVEAEPAVVEQAPEVEKPVAPITTAYTVQKGDTISAIAYKYRLRWQDVLAVNPGLNPKRMRVGQTVQLPGQVNLGAVRAVPAASAKKATSKVVAKGAAPAAGAEYVVQSGDSLSVIAKKCGVKTAVIREANNLKGDMVRVGQKLRIPGGKVVQSAKSDAKKADAKKADVKKAAPVVAPVAVPVVEQPVVAPPPVVAPVVEAPVVAPEATTSTVSETLVTPTGVAPVAAGNLQTYTVKEGEDVYAVAIRWGVSPTELKTLNGLTSHELKAGQVLKIPASE